MQLNMNLLLRAAGMLLLLGATQIAWAQPYPNRPVRLVVPYAAGTATDVLARTMAERLNALWGQPVVVENQAGANGTIATAQVAKAPADGYTLIMIAANHVINASIYKDLPYDSISDFRALARVGEASFVLAVNPSLPVKTVQELVTLAKSKPGTINYASPGNGTPGHLAMEMLKTSTGADIVHVPYKNAGQVATDLVGGQVQVAFIVESTAIPLIKAGSLRPLAMSGAKRSTRLPDVPTVAESGYPAFDVVSWIGVAGPANMPVELVSTIGAAVLKAMDTPEVSSRIAGLGLTAFPAGADAFGTYMAAERVKWAAAVKASGAKLD